jgi:hypothetical protein
MPHPSRPATCNSFYMLALAKFLSRPRGGFLGFLMRGLVGPLTGCDPEDDNFTLPENDA